MSTDPIFQKSLQDVIKGIRAHKRDAGAFISQLIADIKVELKSTDPFVKGEAIRKLTYIQMLGYNISWASFGIVEVMSQSRFLHKRIGYLAACQVGSFLPSAWFCRVPVAPPYKSLAASHSLTHLTSHFLISVVYRKHRRGPADDQSVQKGIRICAEQPVRDRPGHQLPGQHCDTRPCPRLHRRPR